MKQSVDDWSHEIHAWAKSKGWWETERNFGEAIALMHSELSEALEAWRDPNLPPSYIDENGKPEGWMTELADCVIRIMDFCGSYGISLERAIEEKMAYNQKRPYRHGGKRA